VKKSQKIILFAYFFAFSWRRRIMPAGSPIIAVLQTIDGDNEVGSRKHLDQPVKKALVVVRSGFEILFKDPLRFAHGFESQLPVRHPKLLWKQQGLLIKIVAIRSPSINRQAAGLIAHQSLAAFW
jgi:hypothetical protein